MAHSQIKRAGLLLLLGSWLFLGISHVDNGYAKHEEPAAWQTECVYCPTYFNQLSSRSTQIDSNGRLHIAYGGDYLYYSHQDDAGQWQTAVVDPTPNVGRYAMLQLDNADNPHIIYLDATTQRLKYGRFDGQSWLLEQVPTSVITQPHASFVFDAANVPHLSFYDETAGDLRYGVRAASGWQFSMVDTAGDVGQFNSLAVGENGRLHLSYHDATQNRLKYATFDGQTWQITGFPEATELGLYSSLALDSSGNPHIAYMGEDTAATYTHVLRYARYDSSSWHSETADDSELYWQLMDLGYDISLQLDPQDNPHISYSAYGQSWSPYPWYESFELRYAHRSDMGWSVTLLDEWQARYSALQLTAVGQPIIAYKADNTLQLIEIENEDTWSSTTIATSQDVGRFADIARDVNGRLHLSFAESEGDTVNYAYQGAAGWQTERIDSAGFAAPRLTAVVLTPQQTPTVMYYQYQRLGGIHYAQRQNESWVRDETPFWVGHAADMAVDSHGYPHFAYYNNLYPWDLAYTRWDGTAWREPIFLDDTVIGNDPVALALDKTDRPHIAYIRAEGLGYAVQTPSGWYTDTVDLHTSAYPALSLAPDHVPHIAYFDTTNGVLRHASLQAGVWQTEVVDDNGVVGTYPSLAIDGRGHPHISYFDSSHGQIKYAYHDGTGWQTTPLPISGTVGARTALVVDPFGNPTITYYDAEARDLRVIYRPFTPLRFFLPVVNGFDLIPL